MGRAAGEAALLDYVLYHFLYKEFCTFELRIKAKIIDPI